MKEKTNKTFSQNFRLGLNLSNLNKYFRLERTGMNHFKSARRNWDGVLFHLTTIQALDKSV